MTRVGVLSGTEGEEAGGGGNESSLQGKDVESACMRVQKGQSFTEIMWTFVRFASLLAKPSASCWSPFSSARDPCPKLLLAREAAAHMQRGGRRDGSAA